MKTTLLSALLLSTGLLALAGCTIENNSKDKDDGGKTSKSESGGSGGEDGIGGARTAGGSISAGGKPSGVGGAGAAGADTSNAGTGSDAAGSGNSSAGTAGTGVAGASSLAGASSNLAGATGVAGNAGISTDACDGIESPTNDTDVTATPYALGTAYHACIQTATDVDYYEFTTPSDQRGGYVTVSITNVGSDGNISATLWSAANDGEIHKVNEGTRGASTYFYFNAAPGAAFRVSVASYSSSQAAPNPYDLKIDYHEVMDSYEPNDLRTAATPVTLGTTVTGYHFAGWENSTGIPDAAWYDWYSVELATGDMQILLATNASDVNGSIHLYDSLGSEVATSNEGTRGSSVVMTRTIATAGTYYIRLSPYSTPTTRGNTVDVPQYLTLPYDLTVTQP